MSRRLTSRKARCDGEKPTCRTCLTNSVGTVFLLLRPFSYAERRTDAQDTCEWAEEEDGRKSVNRQYVNSLKDRIKVLEAALREKGQEYSPMIEVDEEEDEEEPLAGLSRSVLHLHVCPFLFIYPRRRRARLIMNRWEKQVKRYTSTAPPRHTPTSHMSRSPWSRSPKSLSHRPGNHNHTTTAASSRLLCRSRTHSIPSFWTASFGTMPHGASGRSRTCFTKT